MHSFSMRNTSGTALGLLPCSQFSCHAFQIEDDDLLVAYTDGITESENACGEPWGSERLETLLRACHDSTPRQVVHYILDEVSNFAQDRFQVDDMTLVVIPVKEGSGI